MSSDSEGGRQALEALDSLTDDRGSIAVANQYNVPILTEAGFDSRLNYGNVIRAAGLESAKANRWQVNGVRCVASFREEGSDFRVHSSLMEGAGNEDDHRLVV